jgi:hypothetical protein
LRRESAFCARRIVASRRAIASGSCTRSPVESAKGIATPRSTSMAASGMGVPASSDVGSGGHDIARVDGVHERQALGGLHHAHDELAGVAAGLLVYPKSAQVFLNRAFAVEAHCRQIVGDDGEVAAHLWSDLLGRLALHPADMVHKRIHGAQQMVVFDPRRHGRYCDRIQPAQHRGSARGNCAAQASGRRDHR